MILSRLQWKEKTKPSGPGFRLVSTSKQGLNDGIQSCFNGDQLLRGHICAFIPSEMGMTNP